eukprot:6174857-Pleurochrysis_carterae.AAC.3
MKNTVVSSVMGKSKLARVRTGSKKVCAFVLLESANPSCQTPSAGAQLVCTHSTAIKIAAAE